MKVGIVGAGQVGTVCLLSVVMRGSASEIVLINRDQKKARGVATDVRYGTALLPRVHVHDGEYADLAPAALSGDAPAS